MADTKISALTVATTPLAGTEVLPIVQSGTTKQVSVANLTAGRAVSASTFTSTVATGTAPFTVTSTTEVANLTAANATNATTASNLKSNATTGVMQIVGPAAASTRVMTIPDANFTAARTDAAQTFNGTQTIYNASLYFTNPANSTAVVNELVDYTNSPASTSVSNGFIVGIRKTDSLPNRGASVRFYQTGTTEGGGYASTYISFWTYYLGYDNGKECWRVDQSGNFVQAASGYGVNFSANSAAAGKTSQLLNYYEEGTWTPSDQSGAGLTFTGASGTYTRVGNTVRASFTLTYPSTASGVQNYISLPIASNGGGGMYIAYTNYGSAICGYIDGTNTRFVVADFSGNALTNANLSGKRLDGVVIYRTA